MRRLVTRKRCEKDQVASVPILVSPELKRHIVSRQHGREPVEDALRRLIGMQPRRMIE